MVKLKSKKIMFVLLMGIIACLASLFICFGQNAYADEDFDSDDRAGYIVLNPRTSSEEQEDFTNIHELIDKCNKKHANVEYIIVNFEKDLNFEDSPFHVDKGRTITFNLGNHKMYNNYPSENTFFWVAGTLYLSGDKDNHGIIEGAHGTTNASIISDRGQINASNIDFVNDVTKDDSYPDYASHLYFANTTGASTFENCKFSGGKAEYGGSVFVRDSADPKCSISFNYCDFNKCRADYQGGAIYNKASNSYLGLDHTTISECHSHNDGGAILMNGSNQHYDFKYMTIDNCYSEVSKGGAIYSDSEKSVIDFDYSTISNCTCQTEGGAIATVAKHEYVTLNNSTIDKCKANKEGGAISTEGDESNVVFNTCTINECRAHHGGAIYNYSNKCNYSFNHTNITKCESEKEGGAIYSSKDDENYYFDNSTIDSCHAGNDGGAIFVYSSHVKITGTQCKNRPLSLNFKGQLFNSSTISNCSSDECGGAIYTSNETGCGNYVHIEGLNFVNNKSTDDGGAIDLKGDPTEIHRCCFDSNYCKNDGGAIRAKLGKHGKVVIADNEFYGNKAEDGMNTYDNGRYYNVEIATNNKIYWLGEWNFDKEVHWCVEQYSKFLPIEIKDYKILGRFTSIPQIGKGEELPIANLDIEFLDENDKVIHTTRTDENGNYKASFDFASKVKVKVHYNGQETTSALMDMYSDHIFSGSFIVDRFAKGQV